MPSRLTNPKISRKHRPMRKGAIARNLCVQSHVWQPRPKAQQRIAGQSLRHGCPLLHHATATTTHCAIGPRTLFVPNFNYNPKIYLFKYVPISGEATAINKRTFVKCPMQARDTRLLKHTRAKAGVCKLARSKGVRAMPCANIGLKVHW